ncbi:MAG: hypothetical protein A2Y56_04540 [Candidatus Aminicenantes bacterium RBG_13_63_10]|nr:MAG: hypothetical protein A2Y56_04540 [Candidatus Aminicenantes bacterium RBG_13_63_10]
MFSSLFDNYLSPRPSRRLKGRQAAGLAITLAAHALLILGAVKARFEIKLLPIENKIAAVYLGPRVKVGLPADYEKHLAGIHLLESGGDAYWGDIGRGAGRGGPARPSSVPAESSAVVGPGDSAPGGASAAFVLSYRPGSEKSGVPDFDLRQPGQPEPSAGRRAPRPGVSDPRLKSYPSTDIRGSGPGEGYALARSATGDRVIYRGNLPPGARNVDLTAWGREVVESVQKHWVLPLTASELKGGKVGVTVVVEKDGRASLARINNSSHIALLDRSALSAITASLPFPPLPEGFPGRTLEAFFLFDCYEKK